jgi:TolB-like protein/Flp pilus assembly protein TadD
MGKATDGESSQSSAEGLSELLEQFARALDPSRDEAERSRVLSRVLESAACPAPDGRSALLEQLVRAADGTGRPDAGGREEPVAERLATLLSSPEGRSALVRELARTEHRPSLAPGARIGRFALTKELGRGGFGIVFQARDEGLGRDVALKLLRPGSTDPTEARQERMQREAAAVARLSHPSIVTLHNFGTCDEGPYLVMELLHGESLQRRIRREPIPLREAFRISIELARALAHAHGAGILHRDLKPGNLFLTREGAVKVLDFGLALVFGAAGRLAGGTPAYMSPEQWRDAAQDARTDVWSAAVILFQLLSGELPFHPERGWDPGEPGKRLDLPSLPGVPPSLASLLRQALSIDPSIRPADGRAWLEALLAVEVELESGPRGAKGHTRIAVLPFVDLGPSASSDFLAASLTELLIAELGRVPSLRVTSRTTAMAYLGSAKPLRQIGEEMGVTKVIEGSVLRTGDLLQISVRLVDPATERQDWANRYRKPIGSVLEALDGVVAEVAGTLGALLDPSPAGVGGRSVSPGAMDGFMRGSYHQSKRSPEGFAAAIAEYRAAIDSDPLFAAPFVGLAFVHTMSAIYGYAPTRQSLSLARQHAERALALDPGSGAALGALASVQAFHDHDFREALSTARRAVDLNPSHLMSRVVLGDLHWIYDQDEAAMEQIDAALRLDPLDLGINMNVGDFLVFAGRHDEAVSAYRHLLRMNPHFLPGHIRLAKALAFVGDRHGVGAELEQLAASAPEPVVLETSALCLGMLGDRARALPLAQELDRRGRTGRASAMAVANAWGSLGDAPAALPWLEQAWRELEPLAILSWRYPPTGHLFENARFVEFGRRSGVPRFQTRSPGAP